MGTIWTHKDLDVWQQSLVLAEVTYRTTRLFPVEERYGLAGQMRRAAVSVLSNIAEGAARRTRPDFLNFLHIARGSLAELDAQTTLAVRLSFAGELDDLQMSIQRVGQMLNGLISKVRRSIAAEVP
jgi:four helix bundle protein